MFSYDKLEKFSPEGFYNPKNKLSLYVYERTERALDRARRRRARVKTAEDFYTYRAANRERLLKSLGNIPYDSSLPLGARITGSFVYQGVTVEKIVFESRPGVFVTADFYLPEERDGRIPAVLFQSGHSKNGKCHDSYRRVCITIAKAGIAVLAIDPIGQGERYSFREPVPTAEHQYFGNRAWLLGESLAGYFIADAKRALDYLETRDEIDPLRIGATGSSGGGTMTALLAAVDERIKAAAPGTYITSKEDYLYADNPQDAEQIWFGTLADSFDHTELIACACPMPYAILAVDSDFFCIEGGERTYSEAKRLYGILGASDRLQMTVDSSPHAYTAPLAEAAASFFVKTFFGEERRISAATPPEEEILRVLDGKTVFDLEGAITTEDEILRRYENLRPLSFAAAKRSLERSVFGGRDICEPRARHLFKTSLEDYDAEMLLWFSEPRMPSCGVLVKPKQISDNLSVTVCLWGDGTNAIVSHSEEISRILESGRAAFIPDLVGVGKCAPDRICSVKGSFAYDARVKHNADLMLLGDSYGALFTYQLCRAIDMLREEYNTADTALYTVGYYSLYGDLLSRMGRGIPTESASPVSAEELIRGKEYKTEELLDVMLYGIARLLK